jgi:hypothetical protein
MPDNMNVMNAMMLSCVKATELMEEKELIPLPFMKRMQLKMHVAMCSGCRNYMKQTALINKLLSKTFNVASAVDTTELEKTIVSKIS